MRHDPFYNQIIVRLNQHLDGDLFERCAADLIRDDFPVVPVRGGSDAGMDGAIADELGPPYPLICTTQKDVIGNLTKSLQRYIDTGGERRKCIVATSQSLTPDRQRNLHERASEFGFTLVQLYEQSAIALLLYRSPVWCKELLHLTGTPSALSVIPLTRRPLLAHEIIGRDDVIGWLETSHGDRLLVGEPGSGKTSLLHQLALTEDNRAVFVVDKNMADIATAIRAQEPKIIIFDDAHTDPEFLVAMKWLREEIHADFDLIATCWNSEQQRIADILNISDPSVCVLKRLTRDEMVKVVSVAGIEGIDWLVGEIVSQAEGLPGLAVTLTNVVLKGGIERIRSAEALSTTLLDGFVKRVDKHTKEILACFSIGGKAGMPKQVVAGELNMSLSALRHALARLAEGGIIAEVGMMPDVIKVRPPALRHALLREVFFSGPAALPFTTLQTLLDQSLNVLESIRELISVRERGGKVPVHLLQEHLLTWPMEWRIWGDYAWLGHNEAVWVLDHFQGDIAHFAFVCLENCPEKVIPLLLSKAIGDERLLHANPDHPLRQIQDWIERSLPGNGEAVHRRKILSQSARGWLQDGNHANVGYQAILLALIPYYEDSMVDPGSGNQWTMRFAYLTVDELRNLRDLWNQIIQLTDEVPVSDWSPFMEVVNSWAYPRHKYTDEVGSLLRSSAVKMASDIANKASDELGVLSDLKRLISPIAPDLIDVSNPIIDTLYPQKRYDRNRKEEEAKWKADIEKLVDEWIKYDPDIVIQRISEIERQMSGAQRSYPRLTPALCYRLADRVPDPSYWAKRIHSTDLSGDILFPFLRRSVTERLSGWEELARECLETPQFRAVAAQIILKLENPPAALRQRVIDLADTYPDLIEHLYGLNELPEAILLEFLEHPNEPVAIGAALAEWQCDPEKIVREWLREPWEKVILNRVNDDYWLADIFGLEHDLAYEWLKRKIINANFLLSHDHHLSLPAALSVLSIDQRRDLLSLIPVRFGFHEMVAQIVDDNISMYEVLLQSERLKEFHLAPLGNRELDTVWQQLAKLAFDKGYTEYQIARQTVSPVGVVFTIWGNESNVWKSWLDRFEKLLSSEDQTLKRIAEAGVEICQQAYENAVDREYHEDVYGRDE